MNSISPMQRRAALTMIDVLGFKEKITSPDRARVFGTFMEVTKEILRVFDSKPTGDILDLIRSGDQKTLLFSDTLIYIKLISSEVPECDALVSAATFAIRVIADCLERQLLVRGAIAVGELLYNKEPEGIAGEVVNECAAHYEIGDWVGCHLAPSAASVFLSAPSERRQRTDSRIAKYKMPIVTETDAVVMSEQHAVRWLEYQVEHLPDMVSSLYDGEMKSRIECARKNGQDGKQAVKNYFLQLLQKYMDDNPKAKRKVEHTLALYR